MAKPASRRGGGGLSRAGETDEARLGDRGQAENLVDDGAADFAIEADERERVGAARGGATAQRERGNIDAEAAERGTDAANHAGDVDVAREQQRALEGRFERDAVERENARRAILRDGTFERKLAAAI